MSDDTSKMEVFLVAVGTLAFVSYIVGQITFQDAVIIELAMILSVLSFK